jgi:hypothetical protein
MIARVELLAGDLKDERPEGIERWKLVHPGPRAEIRSRVDHPREHGVRLPEELARHGIGNRGSLPGGASTLMLLPIVR